jgi:hypothetical protein
MTTYTMRLLINFTLLRPPAAPARQLEGANADNYPTMYQLQSVPTIPRLQHIYHDWLLISLLCLSGISSDALAAVTAAAPPQHQAQKPLTGNCVLVATDLPLN